MMSSERDLGLHRHVAGDEDDRSVLTDRAGERHAEPDEPGRIEIRQDDAEDDLHAVRAEARRDLFQLDVEVRDDGLQGPHDERQPDENEARS